jgi:hypothetical protein
VHGILCYGLADFCREKKFTPIVNGELSAKVGHSAVKTYLFKETTDIAKVELLFQIRFT